MRLDRLRGLDDCRTLHTAARRCRGLRRAGRRNAESPRSDEVAYVLSGEITFKTGDEVTVGGPGTCAFLPRGVPHAWKNTGGETGRVLFLYTPAGAGGFFEEQLGRPAGSGNGPEANEMRRRHGWEIVGPPPF